MLSPVAAWYVADILADTAPPANGSPGQIAYKTGTSYGYRDAWAVGFDGRHVVGVWIGRPDGTAVPGISGISSAAPVLFEAFNRIGPKRGPLRQPPPGVADRQLGGAAAAAPPLPPPERDDRRARREARDRLPARRRRGRSRHQSRRSGAAVHQGPERQSALHLLRQWRSDRAERLSTGRRHGSRTAPATSPCRWSMRPAGPTGSRSSSNRSGRASETEGPFAPFEDQRDDQVLLVVEMAQQGGASSASPASA